MYAKYEEFDLVSVPCVKEENNKPTEIIKNLYVSGIFEMRKKLDNCNIKHTIKLTSKDVREFYYPKDFNENNCMYIEIEDSPSVNITKYLQSTYEFIEDKLNNNTPILVHCMAGVSRSVTIIIAYLMKKYNLTYLGALNYVKSRRTVANPNRGFQEQLQNYELFLEDTRKYV